METTENFSPILINPTKIMQARIARETLLAAASSTRIASTGQSSTLVIGNNLDKRPFKWSLSNSGDDNLEVLKASEVSLLQILLLPLILRLLESILSRTSLYIDL